MEALSLRRIGTVFAPETEERDQDWGPVESRIELLSEFQGGLGGLAEFSHVSVVTFLHQARWDPAHDLIRRPRGLARMPELGIFAQRAKDRPNPIGITAVALLEVGAGHLRVRGLDAVDGTPVLDLKPYFPHYDRVDSPVVPSWVEELMRGYF